MFSHKRKCASKEETSRIRRNDFLFLDVFPEDICLFMALGFSYGIVSLLFNVDVTNTSHAMVKGGKEGGRIIHKRAVSR